MVITDIDEFIAKMETRGYRRGRSFHYEHKPEHSLWKSFHNTNSSETENEGYQICIGIWDSREKHPHGGISISYDFKMNYQTPVQVDRIDLHMMEESMDVPEFERRCEALWKAMLEIMPRRVESNYSK